MERIVLLALVVVGCRSPEGTSPPVADASATAVATGPAEPSVEVEAEAVPETEAIPEAKDGPPETSDGALVPVEIEPLKRLQLPEPEGPVNASRIRVGEYECKISRGYRFRPCSVELDEHGRSILTISHALIGIQGVLTDEGKATVFDGIKTRDRPFGCFSCQERCSIDPGSCHCTENPPAVSAQCLMEPVRFKIRKKDGQWRGRIEHHHYYGTLDAEDGHPLFEVDHYVFVMRR